MVAISDVYDYVLENGRQMEGGQITGGVVIWPTFFYKHVTVTTILTLPWHVMDMDLIESMNTHEFQNSGQW